MLKRKEESYLADWLSRKGRKPLIIRGARQIGKSTLVRMFAKTVGRQLVEINFEENPRCRTIFTDRDINTVLHPGN